MYYDHNVSSFGYFVASNNALSILIQYVLMDEKAIIQILET
jgi:hypothetical protein